MKVLFGYTFDYLKRNKRSSIAIMVAVLMTATMMSALCGFLYNVQTDSVRSILREVGNWHGELFDDTAASKLSVIEDFDSVEATMIKGEWKVAQIDDKRREYLVWRGANTAYWNSMPEGDIAILEGRTPMKSNEIALSKQYFENHPELALGDSIMLPTGSRILPDGSTVAPPNVKQPGEYFVQNGSITFKVVAKLDFTTSSTVPAYTALGYLDPAEILPTDNLVIYLRFHNIRDTYKEMPKIAEAVGYQKDEYGSYVLRYNRDYLARLGVLAPNQIDFASLLMVSKLPLALLFIGLMVVALFVLIIHNAFALSFTARLSQLGIFASVGATPKQIKHSVVLSGFLLAIIPLPLGLLLGQFAVASFIRYANQFGAPDGHEMMQFTVGWLSVLPAILLTLLTVWWSALIPARKISKMSPIAAIRQGIAEPLKKQRRFSIARLGKLFSLPGELAANALQARKKSYRTAIVSLSLSFLVLACFLCINSSSAASEAIYKTSEKQWEEQDIALSLYNVSTPEDFSAIDQKISSLDGIKSIVWYNTLRTAAWLPEAEGFSGDFAQKGGFSAIEKMLSFGQMPLLRDGQRRVGITLLGLSDADFEDYCDVLGLKSDSFYEEGTWRGILYNTVDDITTSTKRKPAPIPFLDIKSGDSITLTEKYNDSYEGEFTFPVEISAIADKLPPVGGASFGVRYSVVQILPMSRLNQLADNFARSNTVNINGIVQTKDAAMITPVSEEIEKISDSYFGSGDYWVFDENEYYENRSAGLATTQMMFGFVAGLLAVIGISNAWSTVRGTLNARRREFAMLRSVGLPPAGMQKMLTLEAIMLGLTPILLGLPIVFAVECVFLFINEISLLQWLPYAPWLPICGYIAAVLLAIVAAYAAGTRKLMNENIIEAIKMDSI